MKARFPVSKVRVSDNRRRPRASPPLTPAFATSSTPPLLVACRSLLAARCSLLAAAAAVACRCWRGGGCPRQPLPATFFVRRPSFLHMWELKRFWIDGYMSELVGSPLPPCFTPNTMHSQSHIQLHTRCQLRRARYYDFQAAPLARDVTVTGAAQFVAITISKSRQWSTNHLLLIWVFRVSPGMAPGTH